MLLDLDKIYNKFLLFKQGKLFQYDIIFLVSSIDMSEIDWNNLKELYPLDSILEKDDLLEVQDYFSEKYKIGEFRFSEFSNSFYTNNRTPIKEVNSFCIDYLNKNYPQLSPFELTRIETKHQQEGITGINEHVRPKEMYICFEPFINTNWD